MEHTSGPLTAEVTGVARQFRQMQGTIFISTQSGNNCLLLCDEKTPAVVVVRNIVQISDDVYLIVQRFRRYTNYYSYPLDSTRLGIFRLSYLSPTLETIPVHRIRSARKCVLVEVDDASYASIPLLHQHSVTGE